MRRGTTRPSRFERSTAVLGALDKQVWAAGGIRAWAREHQGFSASFISDVLNGHAPPSRRLLQLLGFAKRTAYHPVSAMPEPTAVPPAPPAPPAPPPVVPALRPGHVWAGFAGGSGGT